MKEMWVNPDSVDISAFCVQLTEAIREACAKHPMTGLINLDSFSPIETSKEKLEHLRLVNDVNEKNGNYRWTNVLMEEVLEAFEAIGEEDLQNAEKELVQVACVAFRTWAWCKSMEEVSK